MPEAIIVNVLCIAIVAATGLFVLYRWTPRTLSPYLQVAVICALSFSMGNLLSNLLIDSETLYWIALCFLYAGLFGTVCGWWLVTYLIAQHQGAPAVIPRWLWHHVPIALTGCALAAALTNPLHGLFITPVPGARSVYGPLWYAGAVLCWSLIAATVTVCVTRFVKAQFSEDRLQMFLCGLANIMPAILNLSYTMVEEPPAYDPTILGFAIATLLFVAAVFRGQVYGATGVRLEDAIEHDARPGLLVDRNGRLVHANQAAIDLFELPTQKAPIAPHIAARLLDRQGDPVTAATLTQADGLFRVQAQPRQWISLEQRPVRVGSHTVGAAWFVRDESGRVRVDEALQAARKTESLGLIAGGIAHDFNNLLVSVIGNAELALLEADNPQNTRDLIKRIQTAGQQGANLAKQLLTYAGKAKVELGTVNLDHVVREITGMLRGSMRSEVTFSIEAQRESHALADATQVSQIALNLIMNAEEALPESGGHIRIDTGSTHLDAATLASLTISDDASPGEFAYLCIEDNGPGMDEDTMRQMFDPFFSTKSLGRGLGLSSSLGTVRSHRGAVNVESQVGQGTSITVYLPHHDEAPQHAEPPSVPATTWPGKRALLVDDNAAVRLVHREMLEGMGFQVVEAVSGEQALACEATSDVAIVDLTMPGLSGLSVAAELERRQPGLPVVLVSGYSKDAASIRSPRQHFLNKPFTREDLNLTLQRAFRAG